MVSQASYVKLTKPFVAVLNPVVLHFTVETLLACVLLLFKLRIFAFLVEYGLFERLLVTKGLFSSLVSKRIQINDLDTTTLLWFAALSVLLSAVFLEASLWPEWSIF